MPATPAARTVASLIRWLPMIFFLFVAAQAFSSREGIPPETISVITAAPVAEGAQARPALARGAERECLLSVFHVVPVRRELPQQRGRDLLLGLVRACWRGRFGRSVRGGMAWRSGRARWRWPSCWVTAGSAGSGRLYRLLDNYNAQWFSRAAGGGADPMQSKTALGHIGWLKGSSKIVIRLEPKDGSRAPTLLREASYRTWKGQAWYSEVAREKFEQRVSSGPTTRPGCCCPGTPTARRSTSPAICPAGARCCRCRPAAGGWRTCPPSCCTRTAWARCWRRGRGWWCSTRSTARRPRLIRRRNTNEDLSVPPKEIPALDQVIAELQLQAAEPETGAADPQRVLPGHEQVPLQHLAGLGEAEGHE